jgi:outer membrane lipoprotein
MRALLLAVTAALGLGGCASNLPQGVREAPEDNPSLAAVQADIEAFMGREVRWGGTIAKTANRERETCIEVVERKLQSGGRPREQDSSDGRFLACVNGFLDPMIYSAGRLITVSGTIQAAESGKVGEFSYRYPVVQVSSHHLWQPEPERPRYVGPDPFWYGPPYGPFWRHPYAHPWYGYPYW